MTEKEKIIENNANEQKPYWSFFGPQLLTVLKSNKEGLAKQEAEQRLAQEGPNRLVEEKKKSVLRIFLEQFLDLLVIILIVAAVISMLAGNPESTVVILVVLLLNALLGTLQYCKAQKSLESLKKLSAPKVKVLRDKEQIEIFSDELVPGDICMLEAGDMVAADGRILNNYSLRVNESTLTGESQDVDKTDRILEVETAMADRINMVYAGSLVTGGRAKVLITATGMHTELGKIAELLNRAKKRKTPLENSLDQFSQKLAICISAICVLVFGLCVYQQMGILNSLMFAVALAVAAIPEALSAIVTIVLALGTQKMAEENAIVRELRAVESLGCTSVICSDKTGTLTQNKMQVQAVFIGQKEMEPEQMDITDPLHRYFLYDAILTNDAQILHGKETGDPTETALLDMFRRVEMPENSVFDLENIQENTIREMMERKEELPFDSDRKLMSTKYTLHGTDTLLTKGAVDVLLKRCNRIYDIDGVREMRQEDLNRILAVNKKFSTQGLRVLSFAYKETEENLTMESENDLIFTGLAAMSDPPRPQSAMAVADAKKAGIRTVMITGDHITTAVAIAKKIGIYEEGDLALTGMQLDALSQQELDEKITKISVYARVSPENKIRIVEAWQRSGYVAAMTGDGVNDAPALKKADIGIAMGITGTEVSKDAAAMILADDNFATIMKAVLNGRKVYRNIKNAIGFLLSGNFAGILSVLYTSVMGLSLPFAPVHLLFINLLTDSLPAIAIGMEKADDTLLQEKPRKANEGIMTGDFLLRVGLQGGLIAIATMMAYFAGQRIGAGQASTMAFATLTLARLFHGFNCRGQQPIWKMGLLTNKSMLLAFISGVALLAVAVLIPGLHSIFNVTSLSVKQLGEIILFAVSPTVVIQLFRSIRTISKRR